MRLMPEVTTAQLAEHPPEGEIKLRLPIWGPCQVCGLKWFGRTHGLRPASCTRCKAKNWWEPRGVLPSKWEQPDWRNIPRPGVRARPTRPFKKTLVTRPAAAKAAAAAARAAALHTSAWEPPVPDSPDSPLSSPTPPRTMPVRVGGMTAPPWFATASMTPPPASVRFAEPDFAPPQPERSAAPQEEPHEPEPVVPDDHVLPRGDDHPNPDVGSEVVGSDVAAPMPDGEVPVPVLVREASAQPDEPPPCCSRPTRIDGVCLNCGDGLDLTPRIRPTEDTP